MYAWGARYLKLDILEQKVVTFNCSQSRGAYDRDTFYISSFESSWPITGP
jgi:hypothetical protein